MTMEEGLRAVGHETKEMKGWCILQTSGPKTLPLAKSLAAAGFGVWTPTRTIRRPAPGQRRALALGRKRKMVEVQVPILPGFVFAPADAVDDLARAAADTAEPHPRFALFTVSGDVRTVTECSIVGLREAEAAAEEAAQAERDAETREEAQRLRAERMRTERDRLKMLKRERKAFDLGQEVLVIDAPAFAGIVGKVVTSDGATATVDFGGTLTMKVEAWRVVLIVLGPVDP